MTTTVEAPFVIAQPQFLLHQLHSSRTFFELSTSKLTDEHSSFAPFEGLMTVTQQIAHTADTFDWFHDALLDMEGFDMDFEAMTARINKPSTVTEAREWFGRAHDRLVAFVEASTPESLAVQLPENDPVIPGAPRAALVAATVEHTAHHRGVLTVYARHLGLVPPMPYGEMPD
ncbi:MAG: DinB family protein [Acidobacteriota bacterium]